MVNWKALGAQRRLLREGAWAMSGQVVAALAGVAGVRVLTELAPLAVFGAANLLVGAVSLGRNVVIAPLYNAQLRFHPRFSERGQSAWAARYFAWRAWIATGISAAAGTLLYLLAAACCSSLRIDWVTFLGLLMFLGADTGRTLATNRLNAERRQARLAVWVGLEGCLVIAAPSVLLCLWPTTASMIWGQALGVATTAVVLGVLSRGKPQGGDERRNPSETLGLTKEVWHYGLPFAPMGLVGWIATIGDRYVLGGVQGVGEVGHYAAVSGVGSRPINFLGTLLNTIMRPVLFSAESSNDKAKAHRVFVGWVLLTTVAGAVLTLTMVLFGSAISRVLFAPAYREGSGRLLAWVALAYSLTAVTQVFENRLYSVGRSAVVLIPQLVGTVASVGFAIILIGLSGTVGAAEGKAAAFCLQCVATAFFALGVRRRKVSMEGQTANSAGGKP